MSMKTDRHRGPQTFEALLKGLLQGLAMRLAMKLALCHSQLLLLWACRKTPKNSSAVEADSGGLGKKQDQTFLGEW